MRQLRRVLKNRHVPRTPSIERAVAREVEEEQLSDNLFEQLFGREEEQHVEEKQPAAAAEKRRRITGKGQARCCKSL